MKKIILIAFLFIGMIAEAQVVVPKSTTTFSNIVATGNLRVNGSSTLTGIVTTSSLSSGSSLYLNAASGNDVFLQTNSTNRLRINTSYGAVAVPFRVGSTTAPSASLDITGTMSVSGTSTLTGNVTTSSITSTGAMDLGAATGSVVSLKSGMTNIAQFSSSSGFLPNRTRIGSFTTPSATLDVTGTMSVSSTATLASTLKLGSSAVLTGGNTGTIAVLSDAVFNVDFNPAAASPLDATTYYFGKTNLSWATTSYNQIRLPYNCTLVAFDINAYGGGTYSSSETATVSINGTTNYTLSSSITFTASNNITRGTGLSENFNAGDLLNIRIDTPTWVTNPTSCLMGITLWFVRRP